jgi:hypothetical protein
LKREHDVADDENAGLPSNWMSVDLFTVNQAAALWAGVDPAKLWPLDSFNPSEYVATKQMLTAAIVTGQLPADTSTNAFVIIGDHSETLVSRVNLEAFARGKNQFPAFLFDTLAPFPTSNRAIDWAPSISRVQPASPPPPRRR